MEHIPYNLPLIQINNINFIIDTNYVLNEDYKIVPNNLLDFQIFHICDHLNIETKNELGVFYPRNYLLNLISEISNQVRINECQICKNIGLFKFSIPNQFNYKNLGGYPMYDFDLDLNKVRMLDYDISTQLFDIENDKKVDLLCLPIEKKQIEERVKPEKKKGLLRSFLESYSKKDRIELAKINIKNATDKIGRLGKIDGTERSSYIDTIITLLLYPIVLNPYKNIIDTIQDRYTDKNLIKELFPKMNSKEILPIIDEFVLLLTNLNDKIMKGQIINLQDLLTFMKINLTNRLLKFPYYDTRKSFDPYYLYHDISRLLLSQIKPYKIREARYYSNEIEDPDIIEDDNNVDHIVLPIEGDLLHFLITNNEYDITADENADYYCERCNEFIDRNNKLEHENFHKSNIIPLAELLDFDYSTLRPVVYTEENISYRENNGILEFYNEYTNKIISNAEELGIGKKYNRAEYSISIFDVNIICFYINRSETRINRQTNTIEKNYFETQLFFPNKIINDKSENRYELFSIIVNNDTNYLLFILLEKIWYVYDSNFDPDLKSDYLEKIGDFNQLLNYRDKYVQKMGIMYFYKLI